MADRPTSGGLRIGIDLGGTKISGVVLTPTGHVLASRRVPTPRGDYAASLDAVTGLVALLEDAAEAGAGSAGGACRVGVGTPGTLQAASRTMKNCNSTWLNGRPLLDDLEAKLGTRVRIANDADCFALSEASDGAGEGFASVFGVILGTGVGGGLVMGGTLFQGRRGLAGEWGHTPLPYLRMRPFASPAGEVEGRLFQLESSLPDRSCYCGRLNCIETFLSGPGLAASHQALWEETRSPEEIACGESERDRLTLRLYAEMLGRSLAQVVNLLDPGVIVLGGGISNVDDLYGHVASCLPRYLFAADPGSDGVVEAPPVRPARWGDDSGVRGAAWLWPQHADGPVRPRMRTNG